VRACGVAALVGGGGAVREEREKEREGGRGEQKRRRVCMRIVSCDDAEKGGTEKHRKDLEMGWI
jgi:hypothetical protein